MALVLDGRWRAQHYGVPSLERARDLPTWQDIVASLVRLKLTQVERIKLLFEKRFGLKHDRMANKKGNQDQNLVEKGGILPDNRLVLLLKNGSLQFSQISGQEETADRELNIVSKIEDISD